MYPDDLPTPDLNLTDLESLQEQMINMERTVIVCTICIVAAFLLFLPPIIYLYIRKLEKGIWVVKEQNDNLLEYYKNIPDEEDSKTIV